MFTPKEEEKIDECVKENFFSHSFFRDVAGCLKAKGFSQEKVDEAVRHLLNNKEEAYEWAKVWGRVSREDPNKVLDEYFQKKSQQKRSPQRKSSPSLNKKK